MTDTSTAMVLAARVCELEAENERLRKALEMALQRIERRKPPHFETKP